LKTAIIGNGHWSKVIQKYIHDFFEVQYIADSKFDQDIIWKDKDIKSVFVITPIPTHYEIARKALENNKHVFVEKPMTMNYKEAVKLSKIANKKDLVLFTDFQYLFSMNLKLTSATVGAESVYIKLYRTTLPKHKDINVHWFLTPHILSILDLFRFDLRRINLENTSLHSGIVYGPSCWSMISVESDKNATEFLFRNKNVTYNYVPEKNNVKWAIKAFSDDITDSSEYRSNYNLNLSLRIIDTIQKGLEYGISYKFS